MLRFVLERHEGSPDHSPSDFAKQLEELRAAYFVDAARAQEEYADDGDGYLDSSRRTATRGASVTTSTDSTHPHLQVHLGETTVEIDEQMADLIVECYRAGIDTTGCCQNTGDTEFFAHHTIAGGRCGNGRAYVSFATRRDLVDFHTATATGGPRDEFYERAVHWAAPDAWLRTITLDDLGLSDTDDEAPNPPNMVPSTYQVEFPTTDIPEIVTRLRRFNNLEPVVHGRPTWESVSEPEAEIVNL